MRPNFSDGTPKIISSEKTKNIRIVWRFGYFFVTLHTQRPTNTSISSVGQTVQGGVDTWLLINNGEMPRTIIATGGKGQETIVEEQEHYKKIEEYVKSRTSQTD